MDPTGKHSSQDLLDDIAGEDIFWHDIYASFQILLIFALESREMKWPYLIIIDFYWTTFWFVVELHRLILRYFIFQKAYFHFRINISFPVSISIRVFIFLKLNTIKFKKRTYFNFKLNFLFLLPRIFLNGFHALIIWKSKAIIS